jgi:CRISPR-associated protein Cmr3
MSRCYSIRGLDLSLFRDGRPFTADSGGGTVQSFPIPAPQTVAGFVRTQLGKARDISWTDSAAVASLRAIGVRGPLLQRDGEGIFVAPRDATVVQSDAGSPTVARLTPFTGTQAGVTNLPADLIPLAVPQHGKPVPGYGSWPASTLEKWLTTPDTVKTVERIALPQPEERMHVRIARETLSGEDGQLYGVSYTAWESKQVSGTGYHTWSLQVAVDDAPETLAPVGVLGGENRLGAVSETSPATFTAPAAVVRTLQGVKRVRLILATPALFDEGWYASWMQNGHVPGTKVRVKLRAAAVGRRQAITGWDYQLRQPKPVQLAVAAGSVYFFDICDGDASDLTAGAWLTSTSSTPEARLDGFGLALWGIWE